MIRFITAALLSLSAATASAAPAKAKAPAAITVPPAAVCASINLPFAVPPDEVTAEWCDADYQAWLDDRAAFYCARHEGSAWCACYVAGAFDL